MITRRNLLKSLVAGTGATLAFPLLANAKPGSNSSTGRAKRVIFYLQQHGFSPKHCVPENIEHGAKLTDFTLPAYTKPLEAYKDRVTIVNGLHGKHVGPGHSGYYGALGGYKKAKSNPPAATIDAVLSQTLPETPIGQLCIGLDNLANMRNRPIFHSLTASAPGRATPMVCNPTMLYKTLFGAASKNQGDRLDFAETTKTLEFIERQAGRTLRRLPSQEQRLHAPFVHGCRALAEMRKKLAGMSDHLANFVPAYDERFSNPEFELDWHKASIDVATAAMQAGLTNMLTIAVGCGEVNGGSYNGLGSAKSKKGRTRRIGGGHQMGHTGLVGEAWEMIVQHNMNMLIQMMRALEATPEGDGNMMDNTLIVYISNNAETQHSRGGNWPVLFIGDLGGTLKTGLYHDFSKSGRPINAFYTTLLHAIGKPVDRFNMDQIQAKKHDTAVGPIEELLA